MYVASEVEMIFAVATEMSRHSHDGVSVGLSEKVPIVRLSLYCRWLPSRVILLEVPDVLVAMKVPEIIPDHTKGRTPWSLRT